MGIASDLRESVLQAAIQGKLTEQLATDGNAKDLLKQIKAEKDKLIADKKIKKEKALAPISDDEKPFDIPDNWEWCRLGNISSTLLGKTLNAAKDSGVEKPYLCSINIYWEGVNLDKVKTAKFSTSDIEKYRLIKGDTLICEGGDVGRTIIWESDEEMYYQNALHRVRYYANINVYYVKFVLHFYKWIGLLDDKSKGMTIKHLVQGVLNDICIPLPPLAEQERIVAKVDELMKEIDELEKIENELESIKKAFPDDMKSALLQAAMKGELTERLATDGTAKELLDKIGVKPVADTSDTPFDIPDDWEWVHLGDFVTVISGTSYGKTDVKTNGLRIFRGGNLVGVNLQLQDDDVFLDKPSFYNKDKCIKKNDIVIVASTGSITGIGRPAFCDVDLSEECQIGAFLRIIRCNNVKFYPYFKAIFNSFYYRNYISKEVAGIGIKNVKADHINNLAIPLPPLPEQERIVAQLDKLLPLCESLS